MAKELSWAIITPEFEEFDSKSAFKKRVKQLRRQGKEFSIRKKFEDKTEFVRYHPPTEESIEYAEKKYK